jgi:hypothetical protein
MQSYVLQTKKNLETYPCGSLERRGSHGQSDLGPFK